MNTKLLLAALVIASSPVLVTACAHEGYERSSGEVIDDSVITTKVKSALLGEKDINSMDIKVETFNGTVQLSGFVDSQWQIDKAVQVASSVGGVQHVKNDLIHKPN
ncbi:BON domain-containing protein [Sinimarinibacterium sp. CAU 1509]|uniref:BON domain-containing protein n=1 Tax=Sinimarinibacterium sp. CAU 1509 TaxID=2562283 RepID=UPI0010AD8974|nr:BON domain-containing protein [Sinimarinibacterium sp. CAU 1509]TJY62798.1 BON domain-containing protein [Sinimarinibacterium sp. CAU 1509]